MSKLVVWGACLHVFLSFFIGSPCQADVLKNYPRLQPAQRAIIAEFMGEGDRRFDSQFSLDEADEFAQKNLVRPPHTERLSEAAVAHYKALWHSLSARGQDRVQESIKQLGLTEDVLPPRESVDFVVINGSTVQNVRQRIAWVGRCLEEGRLFLSPKASLVFLDGERPLFASETPEVLRSAAPFMADENWREPENLPQDERQMVEMVWEQMKIPAAMRRLPIVFIHAQKMPGFSRATTADCVRLWLKHHPTLIGKVLVVSSNPFVEYQRQIFKFHAKKADRQQLVFFATGPYVAPSASLPHFVETGLLLDAFGSTLHMLAENSRLSSVSE